MANDVLLGYEIGTGAPVRVPMRHMAVTGQTQEAGKTTALEALVQRSGVKALAFVTKRGEGAFADAVPTAPYFREQADWQFVASILEASRGEKLKFERAWIIRASRGASTLADVQRNVRKALADPKIRGINADVYLTLDAYLEAVVPQIDAVQWARRIVLAPGLNVMDLTRLNVEMQHLVIRSSIMWVLDHERDTVVVVPEAWKFIPQGRGTPVKLAAESYIRQAAGLGNYLWLDSQDIAGVDKIILKSVPVWILGVQRESNEIKRTLAQIPASVHKPTPGDIATLELGQFVACFGKHSIKTYARPAWMNDAQAQQVATGQLTRETAARLSPRPQPIPPQTEDTVNESEARALRDENDRLKQQIAQLEQQRPAPSSNDKAPESAPVSGRRSEPGDAGSTPTGAMALSDELYAAIRVRLLKDPVVLKVATTKPELEITVTRQTVQMDGGTWVGRVAKMLHDGFFDSPRKSGEAFKEAVRHGATGIPARADEACKKLLAMGFVTREEEGFRAVPDMKVNIIRG